MAKKQENKNVVNNGLANALDLNSNVCNNPLNNPITLMYNINQWYYTFDWMLLTNAYKSIGFIQTAINQIVDDAFRNDGLIIDTKTLDTEELEQLRQALIDNGDIEAIKDAIRWGQLYGGGTVMAMTDQNPELPLDEKQLKGKKLKFVASDRWHCTTTGNNIEISDKFIYTTSPDESGTTMLTLDRSRVGIFSGLKCPDHIRLIMQGWGLSIFEAVISPLTQYLKSMSVALELLDEAKIDVIKILDLANTLMTPGGEEIIKRRLALVTQNKNYKSSIAMDAQDDYQQKQITFSGLPDMIEKIQYLVCSALKRPYSKVFGKGSSGFSSGEDDLENYNTVVDSEIRTPATNLIKWVVDLRCLQLFGRKLPDFTPQWKPLRVMSEKDESEIKSRKMTDYLQLVDRQIMTKQQCAQHLTEDGIVLFSPEEISSISNEFEPNDYSNVEDLLMD
jgi:phage-related protein (TIGR01555 family)